MKQKRQMLFGLMFMRRETCGKILVRREKLFEKKSTRY